MTMQTRTDTGNIQLLADRALTAVDTIAMYFDHEVNDPMVFVVERDRIDNLCSIALDYLTRIRIEAEQVEDLTVSAFPEKAGA